MPRFPLPLDVYCGVPTVAVAEVQAFLDGIPPSFAVASEREVPRDVTAVLTQLRRLAGADEMPAVYWSRGPAQEHYACAYNVSLLGNSGLVFGVGVFEDNAEAVRQWLSSAVAPRGTVVSVLEQPPPETLEALAALLNQEVLPEA